MKRDSFLRRYVKNVAKKHRLAKESCIEDKISIKESIPKQGRNITCNVLQDFGSEEECFWMDQHSKRFYEQETVAHRLDDCPNYFHYIDTVAHWEVISILVIIQVFVY